MPRIVRKSRRFEYVSLQVNNLVYFALLNNTDSLREMFHIIMSVINYYYSNSEPGQRWKFGKYTPNAAANKNSIEGL